MIALSRAVLELRSATRSLAARIHDTLLTGFGGNDQGSSCVTFSTSCQPLNSTSKARAETRRCARSTLRFAGRGLRSGPLALVVGTPSILHRSIWVRFAELGSSSWQNYKYLFDRKSMAAPMRSILMACSQPYDQLFRFSMATPVTRDQAHPRSHPG